MYGACLSSGGAVQWVKNVQEKSAAHQLDGSVVQRLQRFATYGSLKQQVLRIITDELAANEQAKAPLEKVCSRSAHFALGCR